MTVPPTGTASTDTSTVLAELALVVPDAPPPSVVETLAMLRVNGAGKVSTIRVSKAVAVPVFEYVTR